MKDSKRASSLERRLNASKLVTKLVTQYSPVAVPFHAGLEKYRTHKGYRHRLRCKVQQQRHKICGI